MDASLTGEKEKTGSEKSIVGDIYDTPQSVHKRKMALAS